MAGGKYWEEEKPVEVTMGRVILRHFAKAGKLQICSTYEKAGEMHVAKVVTLDAEDVTEEGAELLSSFLAEE